MPRYIDANRLIEFCLNNKSRTVDANDIARFPCTADVVERKKGKWIKMSDADGIYYACSECGEEIPRVPHFNPQFDLFPRLKSLEKTNFCHMCGADNREENKNERTGG